VKPKKGGARKKPQKLTRDIETYWLGTGIETASNMATLGIYVKFRGVMYNNLMILKVA